jgi:subfamily B ATP-binding cassette protein MsbA
MQEAISSIRIVQIFCRENYEVERFHRENMTNFRDLMRAARLRGALTPLVEIIAACGLTVALWLGFVEVTSGRLETQYLFSFLLLIREVGAKFTDLGKFNITVQHAEAASERLVQVLQTPEDIFDAPDAEQLPSPAAGRLTFDKVFFKYKSSEYWVIEDFCLEVAPGQIVALVGPSGAGKTTIANLVPRLYEATKGRLLVDGHDVTKVTLPSLRSQMGIVPQETLLFSGSVKDNIAYGNLEATDEEVFEAARNANAVEFIEKLPQQFDTQVGERGVSLSGGQRQRIAIARALLLNPRILILDEATSLLDSESERLVQQALEKLMKGRTTLVIAHRLSTVRNADIICVLERGRLAEKGSHDELIAQRGLYYSLHQIQSAMGDASEA